MTQKTADKSVVLTQLKSGNIAKSYLLYRQLADEYPNDAELHCYINKLARRIRQYNNYKAALSKTRRPLQQATHIDQRRFYDYSIRTYRAQ